MTDYYLSTGISGKDSHQVVKNADIYKARVKAREILDRHNKPVRVYKIISRGKDTEYLGTVQRWGYYVDANGIDWSDEYACWVSEDGKEYPLLYRGTLGRRV